MAKLKPPKISRLSTRRIQPLRFFHYSTVLPLTGDTLARNVPACKPEPNEWMKRTRHWQLTDDREKVTCVQCQIRMGWVKPEDFEAEWDDADYEPPPERTPEDDL